MTLDTLTLIAWCAAIVAAARKQWPKIDGPWVFLAVAVAALTVSGIMLAPMPEWAKTALAVFAGAIGGTSYLQSIVDRSKGNVAKDAESK